MKFPVPSRFNRWGLLIYSKRGCMETYELEPDKIINWAIEYASYEDLEQTAKALYSLYKTRQKAEKPELYKDAKQYRKKYNKRRLQK